MSYNFNFIGNVDVSFVKEKLKEIDESLWLENTIRQEVFNVHKHTETIDLMWDMESLYSNSKGTIHPNFYKFNIDSLLETLKPTYQTQYGDGDFIRVVLVKLKKNTMIYPHMDNGDSLSACKRTHIAIITNPKVTFTVGDETKYLKEGEIWEINNQNMHSVVNDSDEDRIHFIIDYYTTKHIKTTKSLL